MKEMKTYMTIGLTDNNEAGINISPNLTLTEALQLLGTLSLHILNAYREVAKSTIPLTYTPTGKPEDQVKYTKSELDAAIRGITESMYDAFDSLVSNVLTQFYPDAPRNSIEDEAILELTNELIEKRYNALSEQQKKLYSREYNKMKLRMQLTPHTTNQTKKGNQTDDGTGENQESAQGN